MTLANGEPLKEVSDKRRDISKLHDIPYEAHSSIKDGLQYTTIHAFIQENPP